MRSLLQQLENNEAVLVMYAADELPEQDRAEVEQMLAVDPGLRESLRRLVEAQETVARDMARLDAVTPLPISEFAAARRVANAVSGWHAGRAARPAQVERRGLRYPWWAYPAAAAASVVVAFLVWWGNKPEGPPLMILPADQYVRNRDADNGFDAFADIGPGNVPLASWDPLDEVERELLALSDAGEFESPPFFSEPAEPEAEPTNDF